MGVNKKHEAGRVINPGEAHLPCVVLLDISESMGWDGAIDELNEGMKLMIGALKEDSNASGKVDICVITFDDEVNVYPFVGMDDFKLETFTAGGKTAMNEAIIEGLNQIDQRRAAYKKAGTPAYTPWMFLITDGYANDEALEGQALAALQSKLQASNKKLNFYPMGVGNDVDVQALANLANGGVIFQAKKDDFKQAFVWLSDSLSSVSQADPGMVKNLSLPDSTIKVTTISIS